MINISEEIRKDGIQEGIKIGFKKARNRNIKNLAKYLKDNYNLTEKEALKKAKEILIFEK